MNQLHKQTGINIQEKANMIWNIADIITGTFKPHQYGQVILPFTVLKRLDDTLKPTKSKVLETYVKVKDFEVKAGFLEKASGYAFYNTSPFTFENLLNEPDHIEDNFKTYLGGYSENVQDIIKNFDFMSTLNRLVGSTKHEDKLFYVIQEFNKPQSYLGIDKVTTVDMGYVFEELVRKFSESYDEDAGQHFTSRDIIYTMTDLLLADDHDALVQDGVIKTVYDMAMGTSQMLTCMEERLLELDADAEITTFGQEINHETYSIAKSDAIIKGSSAENMRLGDTLANDKFEGYEFDYIISNPPFGRSWSSIRRAIESESKRGTNGRFSPGLPKVNDGQMLFTLNGIKKLKDTGKMAIIHNGSPFFNGDAESGPSEIRRHIIENDWLEAIVQLPQDVFYNTGISTYIWIISKNKPIHRVGKVQLIDASEMYVKRRKGIGEKKVDLDKQSRDSIVKAYGDFDTKTYKYENNKQIVSRVYENEEFGYYKIVVESPQLDSEGKVVLKKGKPIADTSKRDTENVPMIKDKDVECTVREYFEQEVLKYKPNSWVDYKKIKVGYEIPFTRYFYKYKAPENSGDIAERIGVLETEISKSIKKILNKEGE